MIDSNKKQLHLQYIDNQIVNGTNEKFKVINTEAGLGKSLQAEKSMIKAWVENGRKSLYVTRFKDTKVFDEAFEELLYTSHGRINAESSAGMSLAIDSDAYRKIKDKNIIKEYPIVIITHEKYKILCKDNKQRKYFTDGRTNLIIDEEPNMIESYTYNLKRIEWYSKILPRGTDESYNEIIKELETYLQTSTDKSFFNAKGKYSRKLASLKSLINKNVASDYAKQFNRPPFGSTGYTPMNKSLFLEEIEILKEIYSHTGVVDKDTIYTYNSKIKYWTLQNNILLDANGGFNYIYRVSGLFEVAPQSKVVDHSNWNLNICNINSSKSSKGNFINYYKEIENFINSNTKTEDKVLIIGNKEDEKQLKLNSSNLTTEHFGNLIGKNDWRDYNTVYLIHNPNTPFYVYVLKYLYYSEKKLDNRTSWDLINANYIMQFKNEELDKIRTSYLSGELYQAIKRIDRDMKNNSQIYIINNDNEVIDIVCRQFKNININNFELDIKIEKQEQTEDKPLTNPQRFILYLDKWKSGDKKKKVDCMKDMGITNKSYFYNKILKQTQVLQYIINNNINTNGHYITKN